MALDALPGRRDEGVPLYLIGKFPQEAAPHIRKIKSTSWDAMKTDTIDFSSDFYWLDDNPFDTELSVLRGHGVQDRLVLMDLDRNPRRLADVRRFLERV